MAGKVYNVKLKEEVKEEWQDLIENYAKEHDIKTLGDVYPHLIDIIKTKTTALAPDFEDIIFAVSSNLASIRSSVIAMNDMHRAYQENALQEKKESEKELVDEIKELKKENKDLKEKLEDYRNKNEEQDEEIKSLKEKLSDQKSIDMVLEKLNSMVQEEKKITNDEPLEGQMTLDDYKE